MHEMHNSAYQMFINFLHSNLCLYAVAIVSRVLRTSEVVERPDL